MNLIAWVVLGAIAGMIANLIYPEPSRGGLLGAIVLGIAGALIGGLLSSFFLGLELTGFSFASVIIAVAGSLLLLFIGRTLRRY